MIRNTLKDKAKQIEESHQHHPLDAMMNALGDDKNFENQSSKSVVSKNNDIVQEEDKEISDNEDEVMNEDIKKNKMRRL